MNHPEYPIPEAEFVDCPGGFNLDKTTRRIEVMISWLHKEIEIVDRRLTEVHLSLGAQYDALWQLIE